jgi:hypothetical protein
MVDQLPRQPSHSVWPCDSDFENLQGHPEGPRLWHKHIHGIMLDSLGFKACTHEHCLYYKRDETSNELILVLRQVDDSIISAKHHKAALDIKAQLQVHMTNPLHDIGIIKRYNGVDIQQTRHFVKVSAETYLNRVLEHHGWLDLPASNVTIPMKTETAFMAKLELAEGPTDEKGKKALETENCNDRKHRRSTVGVAFMLSGAAVYYRTHVQATVAQSSTEAELYSMVDCGKAGLYIHSILEELGIAQLEPTEILCDNQSALKITNAQQPSKHTRHVEIKEFTVQHWVEDELVVYEDVITTHNASDSLSKATGHIKFWEHFDVLMGRRLPQYASSTLHLLQTGIETSISFFSWFSNTPKTPLTNS